VPPAGTRALPRRHQPARAMLRGTYAHARIKRAASPSPKPRPGVLCVLTGADALAERLGSFVGG